MKAEENCGVLQKTADLVTFTEEILNGKLYFFCSEFRNKQDEGNTQIIFNAYDIPPFLH